VPAGDAVSASRSRAHRPGRLTHLTVRAG